MRRHIYRERGKRVEGQERERRRQTTKRNHEKEKEWSRVVNGGVGGKRRVMRRD